MRAHVCIYRISYAIIQMLGRIRLNVARKYFYIYFFSIYSKITMHFLRIQNELHFF